MAQNLHPDPFAEIAFREHPGSGEGMEEIPPVAYEKILFSEGKERARRPEQLTYEEQLSRFQLQLQELREKYRPYLRSLLPKLERTRTREELSSFQFRYQLEEDGSDFVRVLEGLGEWEEVSVPDYRGPTGEAGRWSGYYRKEFSYPPVSMGKRVYLSFKGVDYKTSVYFNGKCVGSHEGFFAPFEFDVTDLLQQTNVLVVEVHNDYPMMGVGGTKLDGDKMYAATGPGWDDPYSGWHHCPPGAGIYNKVLLEERPHLYIQDIFVRPDIDDGTAEVWVDVVNTSPTLREHFELSIELLPQNFAASGMEPVIFPVAYAGPGMNYFRYRITLTNYRLWEPETPYLYTARVRLKEDGVLLDAKDRQFGMRKFHMDEEGSPKGTLYLNNRPVLLRGANEMGHLQQCVMKGDFHQLTDDILIAKLANMNFYRITQRPVQEEIYDYFDKLGMMHQCDLPTFGFIRRNQFSEAVRQAGEMERLIRSHPSSIMVSLINEPSRTEKRRKGHRHMHRDELEAFFIAARQAIYIENPDRVVKNADGDYNPPTREGLPDFHCYNMWYTNNGLSVGKMIKGFLPSLKAGWKAGCGEYGTEGLDHVHLMMKHYPQEWLPPGPDDPWSPDRILGAQTYSMHSDWFMEQKTMCEWVAESQKHQSLATKLMTDAWRRRADYIVSTSIHLLIDAWPSGWMKALIGADRIPKPAFFTYQACLEPVRVHLRGDRWKVYEEEVLEVEAWLLNDSAEAIPPSRITATVRDDDRDYGHYEITASVPEVSAQYAGTIRVTIPPVRHRQQLYIDVCLLDESGNTVNEERFVFEAFPSTFRHSSRKAAYLGSEAERFCTLLQLDSEPFYDGSWEGIPLVVSSAELFSRHQEHILKQVNAGATVVLIRGGSGDSELGEWDIAGDKVSMTRMKQVYFAAFQQEARQLNWMKPDDLAYLYQAQADRIEPVADSCLHGEGMEPVVFTYRYQGGGQRKSKLPIIGRKHVGKGQLVFVGLPLQGRIGFNPTLDRLLLSLLDGGEGGKEE